MAVSSTTVSRRREAIFSSPNRYGYRAIVLLWLTLAAAGPACAASVEELLARTEPPFGVVFEIADDDDDALQQRLPAVRSAIDRIRQRFPQTEFAIVSHGREEFALQSIYRDRHADIHDQVRSLVEAEVPVHVCETHAGWYGISAEDFPDYVDVAPSGPAQIALYLELGYELIIVD